MTYHSASLGMAFVMFVFCSKFRDFVAVIEDIIDKQVDLPFAFEVGAWDGPVKAAFDVTGAIGVEPFCAEWFAVGGEEKLVALIAAAQDEGAGFAFVEGAAEIETRVVLPELNVHVVLKLAF